MTSSVKILNLYAEWYHKQKQDESKSEEPTIQDFIAEKIDSELTIPELHNASSDYNSIMKLLGLND